MQRAGPVSVPHEGCTFYPDSSDLVSNGSQFVNVPTTICKGSQDILLPDNFNVSLVNADTEALNFGVVRVIVNDNYTPLPYLPHLRYFMLYSRFGTPRFPLNGLLIYNKNYIIHLELDLVNMSGLNKADFNGFIRLKYLVLTRCKITALGKDIFEELGIIADTPALSGIFPHLEYVTIAFNDIEQLDWAFLSPISRHLKRLDLRHNNFRSLISTADSNNPVFLESIKWLYLDASTESSSFVKATPRIYLNCGGTLNSTHTEPFSPECGPADPPTCIPTPQTYNQTTPEPSSRNNCRKIEPLIVSVVSLCLMQLILV
ncbi:hypothetical protein BV898_19127 [Hypsibius exemplaris]|uniref:Uncharacterized protein n=1 Tax=Hypsibius exemplaris TaxID=2072580 RepID=A0A9X6RP65_HYPEX|nr:hypothetical protein BV898_19127 [Hypsibius exemplaris]